MAVPEVSDVRLLLLSMVVAPGAGWNIAGPTDSQEVQFEVAVPFHLAEACRAADLGTSLISWPRHRPYEELLAR